MTIDDVVGWCHTTYAHQGIILSSFLSVHPHHQAGCSSDAINSASPKMLSPDGGGGPIVSPSSHPSEIQYLPPHHQQQQQHHHLCSPTSPHNGHSPAPQLSHISQINFQASTSSSSSNHSHHSCDGNPGMPNMPVSPAHHAPTHDFSNIFSNSRYEDINRILREAHFNRVSRINGVEVSLPPGEPHL